MENFSEKNTVEHASVEDIGNHLESATVVGMFHPKFRSNNSCLNSWKNVQNNNMVRYRTGLRRKYAREIYATSWFVSHCDDGINFFRRVPRGARHNRSTSGLTRGLPLLIQEGEMVTFDARSPMQSKASSRPIDGISEMVKNPKPLPVSPPHLRCIWSIHGFLEVENDQGGIDEAITIIIVNGVPTIDLYSLRIHGRGCCSSRCIGVNRSRVC